MAKTALAIFFFLMLSLPQARASDLKIEIDHLVDFINRSDCVFIRNGREHSPEEASKHILRKYDHFKKKIETAEQFVELCATKSTMSHQFYTIACKGKPNIKSKDWLMNELKRFRNR
ncbi:MAG: DUF5329 family protein [Desulfobacterales bacterium]|nr:DUF5329 family protein [Desulfobacterales bacterium]